MTKPLSARDLVTLALRGEAVPRSPCGPLAVHFCARQAATSLKRYTEDAHVLANCVLRYHERYRPDAVWVSADTWVTAEAMGAPVAFPPGDQPLGGTGEPTVRNARDIDRIPPPDPSTRGRMPLLQEALRTVRHAIGSEAFVVACFDQSPFSVACALAGIEQVMTRLVQDRPFVEALVDRCVEHVIAYATALARCGANMLSTGDSPAGLIGPARYRETALPAERRVFAALRKETDLPLSLHICGDTSRILADMATSGADVIEIDHQVDLEMAFAVVPDDVAIWGNIDTIDVLARGSPAQVDRAARTALDSARRHGRRRFVLSSGCTLAVETPPRNLEALLRAPYGTAEPT